MAPPAGGDRTVQHPPQRHAATAHAHDVPATHAAFFERAIWTLNHHTLLSPEFRREGGYHDRSHPFTPYPSRCEPGCVWCVCAWCVCVCVIGRSKE